MSNQLSVEQVLLLNNLMYMKDTEPLSNIDSHVNTKIKDMMESIDMNAFAEGKNYGNYTTAEDWKNILGAVKNDNHLMNVEIAASHRDEKGGLAVLFVDNSTNEAIVVFSGTGTYEWLDNFQGGGQTNSADGVSTAQQECALEWYQSLDLSNYDTITVTGHSKGGNKAKYVTVMDASVDRCLSFDGQGFSDEFIKEYQENIAINQSKITNHNVESDYVNILLNDIGETTYYKAQTLGAGGFLENHCANTFLAFESGKAVMYQGERNEKLVVVDEFFNSYLRSLRTKKKQSVLNLIGKLVEGAFNEMSVEEMIDLMLAPENGDIVSDLLAYLLRYQEEHPELREALEYIMKELSLDGAVQVMDMVLDIMESDYGRLITAYISGLGANNDLPDWLFDALRVYIKGNWGIELTRKEVQAICGIVYDTSMSINKVMVYDDGTDISISDQEIIYSNGSLWLI